MYNYINTFITMTLSVILVFGYNRSTVDLVQFLQTGLLWGVNIRPYKVSERSVCKFVKHIMILIFRKERKIGTKHYLIVVKAVVVGALLTQQSVGLQISVELICNRHRTLRHWTHDTNTWHTRHSGACTTHYTLLLININIDIANYKLTHSGICELTKHQHDQMKLTDDLKTVYKQVSILHKIRDGGWIVTIRACCWLIKQITHALQ